MAALEKTEYRPASGGKVIESRSWFQFLINLCLMTVTVSSRKSTWLMRICAKSTSCSGGRRQELTRSANHRTACSSLHIPELSRRAL